MKTCILSFVALAATLAAATPLAQPEHCNGMSPNTRFKSIDYVVDLFKRSDFELEARAGPSGGGGGTSSGGGGGSSGGGSSRSSPGGTSPRSISELEARAGPSGGGGGTSSGGGGGTSGGGSNNNKPGGTSPSKGTPGKGGHGH